MILDPDKSSGNVMQIKGEKDTSLLVQRSSAAFNFPAVQAGSVTLKVKSSEDFRGMKVSLHNRWFNPTDTVAKYSAMFNLEILREHLLRDNWCELRLEWADASISAAGSCNLFIDNKKIATKIPLENVTMNGISCIHFAVP